MRPYQAFFKKRLQTQSFLDTEMSTTYMNDLTLKIISSLKSANQQSSKKRQKVQMAKSRIKTKQNQQAEQRQKLRTNIESRMRISQTNLQKINSDRKKALSSRSQLEQTRRKKFRQNQKKELQNSLLQVHEHQKQTQKFFRDTYNKKLEQYQRVQKLPKNQRTAYGSLNQTRYKQTIGDLSENSRSQSSINRTIKPISVLKISESEIQQKQDKKKSIQVEKQTRFLKQYVSKMENILNVRKKGSKQPKQQVATLPKVVSKQRKSVPRKVHSISSKKNQEQESPKKKVSFSEMYMQKLNEKRQKKQLFHSIVLQQGDQILEKEQQKTKALKQSKIIKQSLNQFKRYSNMMTNYRLSK